MSRSAISNRLISSEFTSELTSPKVRRSLRFSRPSIVNIDCDLTGQRLDEAGDRQRAVAVRQRHVAGVALEVWRGEQLGGADLVENPIGFAEIGFDGNAGKDATVDAAGDDDVAAGGKAPGRNEIGQQGCEMLEIGEA